MAANEADLSPLAAKGVRCVQKQFLFLSILFDRQTNAQGSRFKSAIRVLATRV